MDENRENIAMCISYQATNYNVNIALFVCLCAFGSVAVVLAVWLDKMCSC